MTLHNITLRNMTLRKISCSLSPSFSLKRSALFDHISPNDWVVLNKSREPLSDGEDIDRGGAETTEDQISSEETHQHIRRKLDRSKISANNPCGISEERGVLCTVDDESLEASRVSLAKPLSLLFEAEGEDLRFYLEKNFGQDAVIPRAKEPNAEVRGCFKRVGQTIIG